MNGIFIHLTPEQVDAILKGLALNWQHWYHNDDVMNATIEVTKKIKDTIQNC